jgi:hypothetical protein
MTTGELLAELRASPTDLPRFVAAAARSQRSEVYVAARTVAAWRRRDPQGWRKVAAWLADNKKIVREV